MVGESAAEVTEGDIYGSHQRRGFPIILLFEGGQTTQSSAYTDSPRVSIRRFHTGLYGMVSA